MTWVKLDDNFPGHPKVAGLGDGAFRLHISGLCHCARYLTDGHIAAATIGHLGIAQAKKRAGELVAAGLWHVTDDGWEINDYLDFNPSKEKVEGERAKARERMNKARGSKDVRANIDGSSPNPVPSRPDPNLLTSSSEELVGPEQPVDEEGWMAEVARSFAQRVTKATAATTTIAHPKRYEAKVAREFDQHTEAAQLAADWPGITAQDVGRVLAGERSILNSYRRAA